MKKTIQDAIKLMTYQMRTLRINHHMTQKQMASILNVSAQSISAYENGVIRPDIEVIMKYAEYFKVDITYLMGINLYGAIHDVLPTQTEAQMFMAYRRRPAWMRKVIRELCFNGTKYRTQDEEQDYAMMLNDHEDEYK